MKTREDASSSSSLVPCSITGVTCVQLSSSTKLQASQEQELGLIQHEITFPGTRDGHRRGKYPQGVHSASYSGRLIPGLCAETKLFLILY